MFRLSFRHFDRYRQMATLLYEHGRSDLVQRSGMLDRLGDLSAQTESDSSKPEQLAQSLESMGPAFIKLGQLLSTRPDILPAPYLEALSRLQDDANEIDSDQVKQIVESELGAAPSDIFLDFDDSPLASASLGQVHQATLKDGRKVVVKIQRPNIIESLTEDLSALSELASFLNEHTDFGRDYQLVQITDSLQESLMQELDYVREARSAETLAENLKDHKRIRIPAPIKNLTTRRVLTMEYVSGAKITKLSDVVLIELDRRQIADDIFRAYLQQVLVDGVFHADPHPGNLSLTSDHQIALMDFGLVARFDRRTREAVVKLVLAVAEGDGEAAARAAIDIGEPVDGFDETEIRTTIRSVVAENQSSSMKELSLGSTMMRLQKAAGRNGLLLPSELLLLGKTLMNLDRTVLTLAPEFDPNQAVKAHASEILARHGKHKLSLTAAYQSLMETAEFAQELPARANKLMKLASDNELRIKVDSIDEQSLMSGIHKVANRITAGLIVAAMIVGASLIMRMETAWTILGYPALAFLLFSASAIAGMYLFWQAAIVDDGS